MTTPVKPTLPQGTPTQVTIKDGDSLGALAQKYNTSVNSIMQANGIKDPDKIKPGQVITVNVVSAAELKHYNDLKAAYEQKMQAIKEQQEIKVRTEKAAKLIEKAKKDGYGKDYSFSINEKGHIVITLKNTKELEDIREDFNLPKGRLRETNPSIEQRYKKGPGIRHDGTEYETYDGAIADKGDTFVIDTNDFKTERTWAQAWQDNVVQPIKNLWHKVVSK